MDAINWNATELANHPFYEEYKKYTKLIISLNVCITAAKTCIELPYPEDTLSDNYVFFAINCQSYFINAVGVREACNLKYLPTPLFSDEDDALLTVGKVLRNIVAHGHLWTPVHRHERSPELNAEYYGISKNELRRGVELAFEGVKEKNQAKYEAKKLQALNYIDSVKYKEYLDISDFIHIHAITLINGLINSLDSAESKASLREISELRKKCKFPTLAESLVTIKTHYQQLLSLQKSERPIRQ